MPTVLVFGTGLFVGVIATVLLVLYLDRNVFRKLVVVLEDDVRLLRQLIAERDRLIAEREAQTDPTPPGG